MLKICETTRKMFQACSVFPQPSVVFIFTKLPAIKNLFPFPSAPTCTIYVRYRMAGDQVTRIITKASSAPRRHSSLLFANSEPSGQESWCLRLIPAIRAEERRRPRKQVETVLADVSRAREIICLSCIFSEWLQTGCRGKCRAGVLSLWLCWRFSPRRLVMEPSARFFHRWRSFRCI